MPGPFDTLPRVGFKPNSPVTAAGTRIEPAASVACASGTIPAATAAALPPLAKAAGTTKMGLYRQFESKDVLITEWVAQQVAHCRTVLGELARSWPDEPRRQLMGFAQFIADDVERSSHRSCACINTIAELPETFHAARKLIETHKVHQLDRLIALCRACGLSRPDRAAIHLTLVLEGAQAVAQNRSVPQLRAHLLELTEDILAAG